MKYWVTLTTQCDEALALKAKYVDHVKQDKALGLTEVRMLPTFSGSVGMTHFVKDSVENVLNKIEAAFKGD